MGTCTVWEMVGYDGSREWRGERRLVNVGASVRACRLILKVELLTSHCCQESNCRSRLSGMPHALSRSQKCILKRSFTHAVIKVKTYVLILFLYSFFQELNRCREWHVFILCSSSPRREVSLGPGKSSREEYRSNERKRYHCESSCICCHGNRNTHTNILF